MPPSTLMRRYSLWAAQVCRICAIRPSGGMTVLPDADAPAEPGRQGCGVLEARPQQGAPAQVAGLVEDNVKQPHLFQVPGQQSQQRAPGPVRARTSSSRSRAAIDAGARSRPG